MGFWGVIAIIFTILGFLFWLFSAERHINRKKDKVKEKKVWIILWVLPLIGLIMAIIFILMSPKNYWPGLIFVTLGLSLWGSSLEYLNCLKSYSKFLRSFSEIKRHIKSFFSAFGLDIISIIFVVIMAILWANIAVNYMQAVAGIDLNPESPDFSAQGKEYIKNVSKLVYLALVFFLIIVIVLSFIKSLIWKIIYKKKTKRFWSFISKYTLASVIWTIILAIPLFFIYYFAFSKNTSQDILYLVSWTIPITYIIVDYLTANFHASFISKEKIFGSIINGFYNSIVLFPKNASIIIISATVFMIINTIFLPLITVTWTTFIFVLFILFWVGWTRFYFAEHLSEQLKIKPLKEK